MTFGATTAATSAGKHWPQGPLSALTSLAVGILLTVSAPASAQATGTLTDFTIVGDAIPAPLTATLGDAARGRKIVDARHVNPATIMPAYYHIDGLAQVGNAWRGKPILAAQQIEDVVAYLRTLRADASPQQEGK